jgi:hypothetical protein
MQNNFQRWVRWALASVCLCAMFNSATAGSFTRGCAARDLQVLMLIEKHENTNTVSAEGLSDAMLEMMHARMICYEGHVVEALAIYDGIGQSITIGAALFAQSEGRGILR